MGGRQTVSGGQAWLLRPQGKLGQAGLVTLLTLMNVVIPFSTDMYTPAVPLLPGFFDTSEALVNVTLIGFFLFMTLGTLFGGPVSDRFGRKPLLTGGMMLYAAASLLCAAAWSIGALIAFRIVQGIAAGVVTAVSNALVKDCFVEQRREQMISILQVLLLLGPVVSPLIGGVLLAVFSWRSTFVALGALGLVCALMTLLFEESLPPEERTRGGILQTMGGLVTVGRNPRFLVMLVLMSLFSLTFFAYIEAGPYVYIDRFGTTPQVYTYFFAVTAATSTLGPYTWLRVSKRVTVRRFTNVLFALAAVASVVMVAFGDRSEWLFCLSMSIFAYLQAGMRPYMTNILLSQQERDTGSASALITFSGFMCGVVGMFAVLLPWPSYWAALAVLMPACCLVSFALWIWLLRSPKLHMPELE